MVAVHPLLYDSQLLNREPRKNLRMTPASTLQNMASMSSKTTDNESDGLDAKHCGDALEHQDGQEQEAGHHAEDVQRQEDADGARSAGASKDSSRTAAIAVSSYSAISATGIGRTSNYLDQHHKLDGDKAIAARRSMEQASWRRKP